MAASDISRSAGGVPTDLLTVIRRSGVLTERQIEEVRARVLAGEYPFDAASLAERLVRDQILTGYQVRRLLKNKTDGLVIDRYVILDRLGSGSMGRVYRACHLHMGRLVALKIIAPEIMANERVIARFQREMKLVGRLDHPNVVRAFDAGQVGSVLYIVMEYVSGQSLGQRFRIRGPLPPAEVVDCAAQAALGLDHAHRQGIVHRDVKPSNLLLTNERRVKLLDLGLGALIEADDQANFATADRIAVGTIDYMSPEQACGRDVDGRSDLYSLGCVVYHLITGRLPYPGISPIERLGKRINSKPTPITDLRPDLPSKLVRVLNKLLANRPEDRYRTGDEAAEALQTLTRRKTAREPASPAAPPFKAAPTPTPPSMPAIDTEPHTLPETPRAVYPDWFQPLADLAERSPAGALVVALTALLTSFVLGAVLALLVR